jgi:alkanesulfonate monooxygenase SsuD/methylene tetrahydromethanopterin reductase-like flavin-dependent oxidoreductase (luciferase family)
MTLAALAMITRRARLGTAVLLPALRQPTVLAHALATLDQIAQGRLVLGLGVGWGLPEIEREWQACGRVHHQRVQDLEEHIRIWRQLWSGHPVTYAGNGFTLTEHTIGPLPWQPAGPPLLITAGNRGEILPAQLDRFARLGDGIMTTYLTDDDCRTLRQRCEEALAQYGRSLPAFPLCVYTTVRIDAEAAQAEAVTHAFLQQYYGGSIHGRGLMGLGPASAVIQTLKRYEAAGVTDVCVRFAGTDQIAQLEQFIHHVTPAFGS